MRNDKYELTNESIMIGETKLYRIKALKDISLKRGYRVKAGCLGGYVESWHNLSNGDSWIADNAKVYGNAFVADHAAVYGNAEVYGNAIIADDASVYGDAFVVDDAYIYGNAKVSGNAQVSGNAHVSENAHVYGNVYVYGNAYVSGNAEVSGNAHVYGNARVYGNAYVSGNAKVGKNALILSNEDYATISGFGRENRTTTFYLSHSNIIMVKCGCFLGDITEFRLAIRRTHDKNGILSPLGDEYMDIANLMEKRFKRVLENR